MPRMLHNIDYEIYTDGASQFNGQPHARGGWGVVCRFDRSLDGRGFFTYGPQTNNRYELEAIKKALKIVLKIDGRRRFRIYSDSKYAIGALTAWIDKWRDNGWVTCSGKPVKNRDLIESIDDLLCYLYSDGKLVELIHVRGHQSNYFNEKADGLAKLAAEENDTGFQLNQLVSDLRTRCRL